MQLAEECGNAKALNVVLLGMLSKHMPFPLESWMEAISQCVPPKTLAVNTEAFRRGRELA